MQPIAATTNVLTIVAMAALGLGVDIRMVAKAGMRVTAAVSLSILFLGLISYELIKRLALAS